MAISTPAGDAPVLPVIMIMAGGYFCWFGIHYFRDQGTVWPSTPVKNVLQGKGIPAPSRAPSAAASVDTAVQAAQAASVTSESTNPAPTPSGSQTLPVGDIGGTGTAAQNKAVMQQVAASFGWTGAEWDALVAVEEREAGFNLTAKNPSSGAYGMAQFIDGPSEYAQYGGNSTTAFGQATAMCNYIKQRYGTPSAAWAHEQNFGWY